MPEEPRQGGAKPGCCMVVVAPTDASCPLPVSVLGFARLTLAVAFLPFGRWEVLSAVGEGPQLLSRWPAGWAPDGSVCGQRTPPPPSSLPSGSAWSVHGMVWRSSPLGLSKNEYAPDTRWKPCSGLAHIFPEQTQRICRRKSALAWPPLLYKLASPASSALSTWPPSFHDVPAWCFYGLVL